MTAENAEFAWVNVPGIGVVEVVRPDSGVGTDHKDDVWVAQALTQLLGVGGTGNESIEFDPKRLRELVCNIPRR